MKRVDKVKQGAKVKQATFKLSQNAQNGLLGAMSVTYSLPIIPTQPSRQDSKSSKLLGKFIDSGSNLSRFLSRYVEVPLRYDSVGSFDAEIA